MASTKVPLPPNDGPKVPQRSHDTPWTAERRGPGLYVLDAQGRTVCTVDDDPTALAIVGPVNAHDDLVAVIETFMAEHEGQQHCGGWCPCGTCDMARAALGRCQYTSASECAMARERSVAGVSSTIPDCPVHGEYPAEDQDRDCANCRHSERSHHVTGPMTGLCMLCPCYGFMPEGQS